MKIIAILMIKIKTRIKIMINGIRIIIIRPCQSSRHRRMWSHCLLSWQKHSGWDQGGPVIVIVIVNVTVIVIVIVIVIVMVIFCYPG